MSSVAQTNTIISLYQEAFNEGDSTYTNVISTIENMKHHSGVSPDEVEFLMNMMTHDVENVRNKAIETFEHLHKKNNTDSYALSLMGEAATVLTTNYIKGQNEQSSEQYSAKFENDARLMLTSLSLTHDRDHLTEQECEDRRKDIASCLANKLTDSSTSNPMAGLSSLTIKDAQQNGSFTDLTVVVKGLNLIASEKEGWKVYSTIAVDNDNVTTVQQGAGRDPKEIIDNLNEGEKAIIPMSVHGNHISAILVKKSEATINTYCIDTLHTDRAAHQSVIERLGLEASTKHYCMGNFQHNNCCGPHIYQILKEMAVHDNENPTEVYNAYREKIQNEKAHQTEASLDRRLAIISDIACQSIDTELEASTLKARNESLHSVSAQSQIEQSLVTTTPTLVTNTIDNTGSKLASINKTLVMMSTGNITNSNSQVIVNPAHSYLFANGDSGVSGSILQKEPNLVNKAHGQHPVESVVMVQSDSAQTAYQAILCAVTQNRLGEKSPSSISCRSKEDCNRIKQLTKDILKNVESQGYTSVEIPLLGAGVNLGGEQEREQYTVNSAKAICEGIKEYLEENENNKLTKVSINGFDQIGQTAITTASSQVFN